MIADFLTLILVALFAGLMALNAALTIAQFAGRREVVAGVRGFAARFVWVLRLGVVPRGRLSRVR